MLAFLTEAPLVKAVLCYKRFFIGNFDHVWCVSAQYTPNPHTEFLHCSVGIEYLLKASAQLTRHGFSDSSGPGFHPSKDPYLLSSEYNAIATLFSIIQLRSLAVISQTSKHPFSSYGLSYIPECRLVAKSWLLASAQCFSESYDQKNSLGLRYPGLT